MQSLNPTRIVQRQGRELMLIGGFVILVGLLVGGAGLISYLLFLSTPLLLIFLAVGGLVVLIGIGFIVRGLTLRMENQPALAVAEVLARELDQNYTFIRNVSRRGLGYIDAVLIGPPGALVFRIVDTPGIFRNEGSDWLERRGGQTFALSRLNPTRECVHDVYALRKYYAKHGLSTVPVFAIVVFTDPNVQLAARQPVVPIAELRTLPTVLRRDFLAEDRIDPTTMHNAVSAIYA